MSLLDLARRVGRRMRGGPADAPPAPDIPPSAGADDAMAQALLALGFDWQAYLTDYPGVGALADGLECARHFQTSGRHEWLRIRFAHPFAEVQTRIEALDLPEALKDQLRIDLAASALWQAAPAGVGAEDLLRPSPSYRPLPIISDSHGQLYLTEQMLWSGRWAPVPLLNTGASARGLGNPESRGKAGQRIRDQLKRLDATPGLQAVLMKFGQVDLEFVYDYRRVRDGAHAFDLADAQAFARDSARRYLAFLRALQADTPIRLVVTAALPPSLNDAALREGYMNAHIVQLHAELSPDDLRVALQRLEMPDWKTRTGLAAVFNDELAAGCAEAGLIFYDDFTPLLGPDGVIHPDFILWHGGIDHHLCATGPAARAQAGRLSADLAAMSQRGWA
ncbi:MAG: hypothetical protein JSR98_14275 [Proteobacteria bacterium]|nr:hypothetical protein [Pseudomonadota bacterium]